MAHSPLSYVSCNGDDMTYGAIGAKSYVLTLKDGTLDIEVDAHGAPKGLALNELFKIASEEFGKEGYRVTLVQLSQQLKADMGRPAPHVFQKTTEMGIVVYGANQDEDREKRRQAVARINERAAKYFSPTPVKA